ncbi:MAG: hypothetical protein WBA98_08165 [Gordonia sp. (in: high G+C Gram-positive bacteria)]|uniref:hypothetical protein n=1 Tax=Gordonia sp. (in: high G+C Gram-positive bacteria) TaxID=84139 RepID=UPI003C75D095
MNHYQIDVVVNVPKHMDRDSFEEMFESIADSVADLTDGIDGDVSAAFRDHVITIHLMLDDEVDESAFARGTGAARTVMHTIGWETPGWEQMNLSRSPRQTLTPC